MTDNQPGQLILPADKAAPSNIDGLDYTHHVEEAYAKAAAYARHMEEAYTEAAAYARHVEETYAKVAAYARHVEETYTKTAAYARNLEQATADYQKAVAQGGEYIRMLESELAKLQGATTLTDTQLPRAGGPELIAYVRTLEKTVADYQAASVRGTEYVRSLETELAKIQKAYADASAYAHSLADYVHRLEIKVNDLEENLRQYQET